MSFEVTLQDEIHEGLPDFAPMYAESASPKVASDIRQPFTDILLTGLRSLRGYSTYGSMECGEDSPLWIFGVRVMPITALDFWFTVTCYHWAVMLSLNTGDVVNLIAGHIGLTYYAEP